MAKLFDEKKWLKALEHPDWYVRIEDEFQAIKRQSESTDSQTGANIRRQVREFFENALENGGVALAESGPDFDDQRQPIDHIVIHHTSSVPGYTLSRMNATHLLNVYVPYYLNPSHDDQTVKRGQPIWSGHFRKGKPSFLAYHWFLRMDGKAERLLPDSAVGWQAGDWEMNCRSVAICLDNDYETQNPNPEILSALAGLIQSQYPKLQPQNVIGHREVNPKTICPGGNFLDGWKNDLLSRLADAS